MVRFSTRCVRPSTRRVRLGDEREEFSAESGEPPPAESSAGSSLRADRAISKRPNRGERRAGAVVA